MQDAFRFAMCARIRLASSNDAADRCNLLLCIQRCFRLGFSICLFSGCECSRPRNLYRSPFDDATAQSATITWLIMALAQFEMKRELRSTDESGMLTSCLDVQANNARIQTRSRRESSLFQQGRLRQRFVVRNGRIPLRLRLASSVGARAAKSGLNAFPLNAAPRSPKRPQPRDGGLSERFWNCFFDLAVLAICPMPARPAAKNRRIQGDGLITPPVAKKPAAVAPPSLKKTKGFFASIYPPAPSSIPREFGILIRALEKVFGQPIWIMIQNRPRDRKQASPYDEIDFAVFKGFQAQRHLIQEGRPAAVLIESGGGDAHFAYRLARLLQRRTKELTMIVPQYAKSAATLLALSAKHLALSRDAELGPLDVQIWDREKEAYGSALDDVQALERLNVFAIGAVDQSMMMYVARTGKRTDVLLPHVLQYATNFLRPLLDKIDTVEYTRKSRELKVAEDYAVRLMMSNYGIDVAKRIARQLVERYATHGFVIDRREARLYQQLTTEETFGLGLKVDRPSPRAEKLFTELIPFLHGQTIIGRILDAP